MVNENVNNLAPRHAGPLKFIFNPFLCGGNVKLRLVFVASALFSPLVFYSIQTKENEWSLKQNWEN